MQHNVYMLRSRKSLAAKIEALKKQLNEQQREFVFCDDKAILGIAGPGSGKTRALTYRAARLLLEGISPDRILLVTFTNKAADEMRYRLGQILGFIPDDLWIGTFHAVGARILRQYAHLVERRSNFSILDEEDSAALIRSSWAAIKAELPAKEERLFIAGGLFGEIISRAKNSGLSLGQAVNLFYPQHTNYQDLLERVYETYEDKKRDINALDFDDLLVRWLELIERHAVAREWLERRFSHVLVDEYQDTNVVQASIVKALGRRASVCVVGDDAQSIYSFRCAEVKNILRFPSEFENCTVVKLEQNYRSIPEILELANCSISHNTEQMHKKLFTRRPSGEKPWVVVAKNPAEEAQFVAQRVMDLYDEGVMLSEMAVLYRSSFLAQDLEMELIARNIPYVTFGGLKFLEKAHIKDVLAWLRILLNPRDEISWRRVVTSEEGIGRATFELIWKDISRAGNPLKEALSIIPKLNKKARAGWERVVGLLRELDAHRDEGPATLIGLIMAGSYGQRFEEKFPQDYWERLQGIERLAGYARRYFSLEAFLNTVSLEQEYILKGLEAEQPERDVLTLSTIHSAKGKEWRAVFVIGLNQGRFPSSRGAEYLEEERRLFYVAVTRAKDFLYLVCSLEDIRGWESFIAGPSVFIEELPPSVYRLVELESM